MGVGQGSHPSLGILFQDHVIIGRLQCLGSVRLQSSATRCHLRSPAMWPCPQFTSRQLASSRPAGELISLSPPCRPREFYNGTKLGEGHPVTFARSSCYKQITVPSKGGDYIRKWVTEVTLGVCLPHGTILKGTDIGRSRKPGPQNMKYHNITIPGGELCEGLMNMTSDYRTWLAEHFQSPSWDSDISSRLFEGQI